MQGIVLFPADCPFLPPRLSPRLSGSPFTTYLISLCPSSSEHLLLSQILAHDFLVELTNAGLLQAAHKSNIGYCPFRDGPLVCPDFDMDSDMLFRNRIQTLLS